MMYLHYSKQNLKYKYSLESKVQQNLKYKYSLESKVQEVVLELVDAEKKNCRGNWLLRTLICCVKCPQCSYLVNSII